MNTSYQIVEAKSTDGGALTISLPWEFELSEIFVVAEHEASGIAKVYEGTGTLTVDGDGNLVVPALFSGDVFRVWVSRKTQIRHDYDSGGDTIDDKTIDAELKELSRKTVENEKELSRSVRVPESGVNMIFPSKSFRSGEIAGFDENGNVAVGENIARVRAIYDGFREVKESAEKTNKYASIAKENASVAIENRQKAKEYSDAAEKSETAANNSAAAAAQSAQNAANSATAAGSAATDAETSRQAAETAKNAAEKAKTDAVTTLQSIRQEAEDVEAAGEQAIENIGEAKNDALVAIDEARDNVYTKSEIDGVSTGAEVVLKMNEIIAMLKDYEAVTGEKLPWEFWEAVMEEFQRWQENPNEVKNWSNGQNPYYTTPPAQKCVVDFNVTRAIGAYSGYLYSFAPSTSAIVFLPGCSYASYAHSNSTGSVVAIYAVATSTSGIFRNSNCESVFYAPNSRSVDSIYINAKKAPKAVWAPKGEVWSYAFQSSVVDMFVDMRSARIAPAAFAKSKMSAENISATLDSLPTWADGASHVITFTGSPGAAELTQESPSVAAAVARGWTVEL